MLLSIMHYHTHKKSHLFPEAWALFIRAVHLCWLDPVFATKKTHPTVQLPVASGIGQVRPARFTRKHSWKFKKVPSFVACDSRWSSGRYPKQPGPLVLLWSMHLFYPGTSHVPTYNSRDSFFCFPIPTPTWVNRRWCSPHVQHPCSRTGGYLRYCTDSLDFFYLHTNSFTIALDLV